MPLLLGKPIAAALLTQAETVIRTQAVKPGLAVIMIGGDPGSEIYVRLKGEAARRIGIHFETHHFDGLLEEVEQVKVLIQSLNANPRIHGVILQLPLPKGWDTDALIALIDPRKDADGFHQDTLERYLGGDEALIPVLPRAIRELILSTQVSLSGEKAVALVNSPLFARVMQYALENMGLETQCIERSQVSEMREALREAKVIVSVSGYPGLVDLNQVRGDAIIIDAGITRVGEAVRGDVAGDTHAYSGWITPIPGGVGPVTIACLLDRVVQLATTSHTHSSLQ